jgi:hypothetical protein
MITSIYRKAIPESFRQIIYNAFLGRIVYFVRHFKIIIKTKLHYLFHFLLPKSERNDALAFLGKHGLTSYIGDHVQKYKHLKVSVEKDNNRELFYVLHRGKKLFFPKHYDQSKVVKDYKALVIEQDEDSAHRYVKNYDDLKDFILLDVGAAEGIFALDTIDFTKKVFLVECLEHWQAPLMATFEPWKDKVEIVREYAGEKTNDQFIALDDLVLNTSDKIFIKMDIEGAERYAIEGLNKTINVNPNIQFSVCTYHRPDDPTLLQDKFRVNGFKTEFTKGFMYWNKRISKGIIRAWK